MLKIAIVDDEEAYLIYLKKVIENTCRDKHINVEVAIYGSSQYFLFDLQENVYFDIYILDIEMPFINGLKIAELIREKYQNNYIVFVTSHLKYSINAFEYNAFRYVKKEDIKKKIPEIIQIINHNVENEECNSYIVATNNRYEKIFIKDIIYIYREGNNAIICTRNGYKTKIRKGLKTLLTEINSDDLFFIDRGIIVNIRYIIKLNNNILTLNNGENLIVSRPHLSDVKKKIFHNWNGRF